MRTDKRAPDQLRPVKLTPNFIPTAEGSVLIEVGSTRVICTASVEEGVPSFQKGTGKGWITGEYAMLPRATLQRTPREISRGRVAGRSQEIQRLIGRSLRAIVRLDALGERTLWLDCDVIQADGGTRTAAITGAYVALALACQRLFEMHILRTLPLTDSVAATSVGLVEGTPLLDLTYQEDSRAEVDMNVVGTGSGRLVEVQASGEGATFTEQQLERLLQLARGGLQELFAKQQEILQLNLAQP
ncbi:MAG: ribonuclease PH [Candidatus Acidoferrales bacterium]